MQPPNIGTQLKFHWLVRRKLSMCTIHNLPVQQSSNILRAETVFVSEAKVMGTWWKFLARNIWHSIVALHIHVSYIYSTRKKLFVSEVPQPKVRYSVLHMYIRQTAEVMDFSVMWVLLVVPFKVVHPCNILEQLVHCTVVSDHNALWHWSYEYSMRTTDSHWFWTT